MIYLQHTQFGWNGAEWAVVLFALVLGFSIFGKGLFRRFAGKVKGDFVSDKSERARQARLHLRFSHPIAIFAATPFDDDLADRAREVRARLKENENLWDDDLPVVVYLPNKIISTEILMGKFRDEETVDLRNLDYQRYLYEAVMSHMKLCDKWRVLVQKASGYSDDQLLELLDGQRAKLTETFAVR